MGKPDVTYSVNPTSGNKPLQIEITDLVIIGGDRQLDFISVAHVGAFNGIEMKPSGIHQSLLGYALSGFAYDYYWDFGDGNTTSDGIPVSHTYYSPGTYTLKLVLTVLGEKYEYPVTINVGITSNVKDVIENPDRRKCYNFGTTDGEGHGWAEYDTGMVVPPTDGALLTLFDDDKELNICFDLDNGLPYIMDVRKDYDFPKLVWQDKVDLMVEDSGIDIPSEIKMSQIKASEESFIIKPMDLKLYFKANERLNQGKVGFDINGLPDDLSVDTFLYLNKLLNPASKLINVPLDRELFFPDNTPKQGNILEIGLQMNVSNYIFTKMFMDIWVYDRAIFPFAGQTNEEKYQDIITDVKLWLSRWNYLKCLVTLNQPFVEDSNVSTPAITPIQGPDNQNDSAFAIDNIHPFKGIVLGSLDVMMWSNNTTPFVGTVEANYINLNNVFFNGDLVDNKWYILCYRINSALSSMSLNAGHYFDIRMFDLNIIMSDSLTLKENDAIKYYIDDIIENKGKIFCLE